MKRYIHIFFIIVFITVPFFECTKLDKEEAAKPWLKFNWPEADSLFQQDNYWIGGDGAYSIDLGNERVLWLFGDSWIDTTGQATRKSAVMVSNTLAIQQGYDPESASINFFWNQLSEKTEAYFPDFDGGRYWPGHGVRVGNKLLLFLMGVYSTDKGLGFEVKDFTPLLVLNPDDDPDEWEQIFYEAKSNALQIVVGSGGVLEYQEHIYAFSAQELESKHDIYLVRWSVKNIMKGRLDSMQWWAGVQQGWIDQIDNKRFAVPVFSKGQTEFTVHYDEKESIFVEIQTVGFGSASIVRRTAPAITGPWSDPETIYSPVQNQFPQIMIYQGKSHPYLDGANLVVTYCTNSFEFRDHLREDWLYYPRFVRIE